MRRHRHRPCGRRQCARQRRLRKVTAAIVSATPPAENAGDTYSSNEGIPPHLLEERVGVGPGTGGVTTRLGADALCVVRGRHVYSGKCAREKEGGGGVETQ